MFTFSNDPLTALQQVQALMNDGQASVSFDWRCQIEPAGVRVGRTKFGGRVLQISHNGVWDYALGGDSIRDGVTGAHYDVPANTAQYWVSGDWDIAS
jgi:hypothetical protein